MRISEEKILFVHIPKTGGTTITYNLCKNFIKDMDCHLGDSILRLYTKKKYRVIDEDSRKAHVQAYRYKAKMGDVYDDFYSFAFTRSPFEQIRSLFWQLKTMNLKKNPRFEPYKTMNFEDFVMGDGVFSVGGENLELIDQLAYVNDKDGNLIVDDVFPYKYYSQALEVVGKKIGIKFNLKKFLRKTDTTGYLYTPDMIEKVWSLCKPSYDYNKQVERDFRKYLRSNVLS